MGWELEEEVYPKVFLVDNHTTRLIKILVGKLIYRREENC